MAPMQIRFFFCSTAAIFLLSSVCSLAIATQDQEKPSLASLLEETVTFPTKEVKVIVHRTQFPASFKTPEHTHKGPGPRYVIKGTVKITEGGKTHTYQAGQAFWESGHPMTLENIGAEEAEVVGFELIPIE
ncbi:cupin domain-containing protein [Nitrosococcus watsonii]|uniref:Cupin 2 conserved barrel domain protein n=1 Tax=Nitrosococcus watsoni (strain C-113) TaxID=105559 RepID=D8K8I6_NITWC|nr:cupin domain-containing protein [Nitrosococcus watsonii]ADJ29106.1 Cupin 2 conserved barrel domain protein [Nitrosococcus watsonii C-113]